MRYYGLIFVVFGLTISRGSSPPLSTSDVTTLRQKLRDVIFATTALDEDGNTFHPLIAAFVRLSFHQCVSGKCTGCVNLNDTNNAHIKLSLDRLSVVRSQTESISIGTGDLWALAGIVALQVAEELANAQSDCSTAVMQQLQFRFGREDCPTSPLTSDILNFPQGSKGLDHVLAYFQNTFGFDDRDSVALLGAHKLGVVRKPAPSNDVFKQFVNSPDVLDNSYYIGMMDTSVNWRQKPNNGFFHWTHRDNKRMLLNSDMCLYKDISFASNGQGRSACTYNRCPLSRTSSFVKQFASDNDAWLHAFASVYQRMTESGYNSLRDTTFSESAYC